jgi:hypothetical protein
MSIESQKTRLAKAAAEKINARKAVKKATERVRRADAAYAKIEKQLDDAKNSKEITK